MFVVDKVFLTNVRKLIGEKMEKFGQNKRSTPKVYKP